MTVAEAEAAVVEAKAAAVVAELERETEKDAAIDEAVTEAVEADDGNAVDVSEVLNPPAPKLETRSKKWTVI